MIVKNEISHLEQCLESVNDIVDEIVIADTGSTDGTLEIVKKMAHRPLIYPWTDDFSAARNFALEHASGDWIIVLDADESLRPDGRELIREALHRENIIAYKIQLVSHLGGYKSGSDYLIRLFRRSPQIRYSGKVHEQITPSILDVLKTESRRQIAPLRGVIIDHYGYDRDLDDQKFRNLRNARLLRLMLSETPDDAYVHYKLSQSIDESPEGKRHLLTSAEIIMSYSSSQLKIHAFAPELLTKAAIVWTEEHSADKAINACQVAIANFPDHPATRLVLGLALLEAGHLDEAKTEIERSVLMPSPSDGFYYDLASHEITAYLALARRYRQQNNNQEAIHVLKKARQTYPSEETIIIELLKILLEAKQPGDVLREGCDWLKKNSSSDCLMLCADAVEMLGDLDLARQWRERAN